MVNETDNSQEPDQKAKAVALLALALKHKAEKSGADCPDENTIACYCDGQLSRDERSDFRARMTQCPDSYALWMAMERHRVSWQEAEQVVHAEQKHSVWQKIMHWMVTPSGITGGAMALASVMLVAILLRTGGNTPELSDSYENIWAQPDFSLDYSASGHGQIKGVPIFVNPALKAFREGIDLSRKSINTKAIVLKVTCFQSLAACHTAEQLYQYAGSWTLLMKASCQIDDNTQYQQQLKTQQALLNRWYQQSTAQGILSGKNSGLDSRIEKLHQLIQQAGTEKATLCEATDELLRFAYRT